MPDVDFMVLCDYVRADGGLLHMIAAGIDRIHAPSVPSGQNVGIALRVSLTRAECDHPHQLQLVFQDEDGNRLSDFRAEFRTAYPTDSTPGWPATSGLALNMGLPLPRYGVYSLELLIDGQSKKSIPLLVERPVALPPGGGNAA